MTTQLYEPLQITPGRFRILRLMPAKKASDPIICNFTYEFLVENPKYEALSYTWGHFNAPKDWVIRLNNQDFTVRENLNAALRQLRKPSKPRDIWIDAICINQDDIAEKEDQLVRMRQIYEQAEQVVIWLGKMDTGEGLAMKSLANPSGGFSLAIKIFQTERKFGLSKPVKDRMSQNMTGEWDGRALEGGEVAQLLDRPWWRRVWIVQEVVLAKRAILMCGPNEVPWESIKTRLRDGVYGIQGQEKSNYLRHTIEGSVLSNYEFPNTEHILLDTLRAKWRSKSWDQSLYNLLYTFRRFECTKPMDRIYAFLGLATDFKELGISPDYSSPTFKVFSDVARRFIVSHQHLLVFNLKRAPAPQQTSYQESQIYGLLHQAHFFDPDGMVLEAQGLKPRKGFVRLPHGWERVQDGAIFRFHNHLTNLSQYGSPLANLPLELPHRMSEWRVLPEGWKKSWDNVGNVTYSFESGDTESSPSRDVGLGSLPSWVPEWTSWSSKDPKPFPSLVHESEPRYWASGISRKVHFASGYDSDSSTLKLTGVLFDKIESIAAPWCPESHLLPVDGSQISTLKDWEALGLTPLPNCPYQSPCGREEAFWRTYIADYAGDRRATAKDGNYFKAGANRGLWSSGVRENFHDSDQSAWQKTYETPTELMVLLNMAAYMTMNGFETAFVNPLKGMKIHKEAMERYKAMRTRIYDTVVNRAIFVTSKGYLGLAPWNAQKGDVVSVLFGGRTPFLLRNVPGKEQFSLVGEAYVYGIMGGELFDGQMGHARLRAFDIV